MKKPLRVGMIASDEREVFREYGRPEPFYGPAPAALLRGLSELPECEVHWVSCVQQPVRTPVRLAGNTMSHAIVVGKWGWLRGAYAGCLVGLRRKLRELQPDVVHGQGTERYCALGAVFSGYPNVLTIHGNQRVLARIHKARPFSFLWLCARLEGFVLPRTDGVVCITTHTRRMVEPLPPRTWVVPNAVDPSFFDLQLQPGEEPVVLCPATISPHKNQNRLIRALDPVARNRSFRLTFLGHTDRTPYSQEFLSLVNDRPWCRYEGFADRKTLKGWLERTAVLALPSLEDNCPIAVLEAAAAGVPIAAAGVSGVPDLVEPEITGLLFDPTNLAEMGAAVERLLADRAFARSLAQRAQARARERFHPVAVAREHLRIYREVIERSARRGE